MVRGEYPSAVTGRKEKLRRQAMLRFDAFLTMSYDFVQLVLFVAILQDPDA